MKLKLIFLILFLLLFNQNVFSKEKWSIDNDISKINFELPLLLGKNVKGEFKNFKGLVEIDYENKIENKGIFSVEINSIEINYEKYKDILLSDIFFNQKKYPIAIIDTKKFSYKDEKELEINSELTIKDFTKQIPIKIKITNLGQNLVQIQGNFSFSRTDFKIGSGNWSSTLVLKDQVKVNVNLFMFRN